MVQRTFIVSLMLALLAFAVAAGAFTEARQSAQAPAKVAQAPAKTAPAPQGPRPEQFKYPPLDFKIPKAADFRHDAVERARGLHRRGPRHPMVQRVSHGQDRAFPRAQGQARRRYLHLVHHALGRQHHHERGSDHRADGFPRREPRRRRRRRPRPWHQPGRRPGWWWWRRGCQKPLHPHAPPRRGPQDLDGCNHGPRVSGGQAETREGIGHPADPQPQPQRQSRSPAGCTRS